MTEQLQLVEETKRIWRLDSATREAGFRGVQAARAALRDSRPAWRHEAEPVEPAAA